MKLVKTGVKTLFGAILLLALPLGLSAALPAALAGEGSNDLEAAELSSPTDWTRALPQDYAFAILRKNKKIGSHFIRFSREGDVLHVGIDITIKVKFGPITAYHYKHRNDEYWRDGRLIAIETRTNDNGKKYSVSGKASEEGFEVTGIDGKLLLPAEVIPTSYWNIATWQAAEVLDSQRGIVRKIVIEEKGVSDCGRHFDMSGEMELDLWYAGDRLCGLTFTEGGAAISYAPL